jgi:hypothetical protein
MIFHSDLLLTHFHQRERELIAEADQHRLLAAARRRRRAGYSEVRPAARGRPDGTLIVCAPREAAPAR